MKFFLYSLALLFIGLKLGGLIDWSWWLVTLPLWGGLAFLAFLILFGGLVFGFDKVGRWTTSAMKGSGK